MAARHWKSDRPAAGERLAHAQPEPLQQFGDRLGPRLEPVALDELSELLGVGVARAAHRGELAKVLLEARGRDDLQDPTGLISSVPERVPLVARLEHEVARPRLYDIVAEQGAHASLEDEAVLVLARVTVQRRGECARRHRVLKKGEALACFPPVDQEPDADAAKEDFVAA